MRRLGVALFFAVGCIHGSSAARHDESAWHAIAQQERWTQQALAARANRAQLDAIRGGDFNAVGRGRKELKQLIQGIDRATWIRNTTAEMMADDSDPQLPTTFDRAARLRSESAQAGDELAAALAEANGGLTIADVRPGLDAVRKAQWSEERIARLPLRGSVRLAPAPLPLPKAFIAPAARLVAKNPDLTRELDRLQPDDAAQSRAQVANVDRRGEEAKRPAAAPVPAPPSPAPTEPDPWDTPVPPPG